MKKSLSNKNHTRAQFRNKIPIAVTLSHLLSRLSSLSADCAGASCVPQTNAATYSYNISLPSIIPLTIQRESYARTILLGRHRVNSI